MWNALLGLTEELKMAPGFTLLSLGLSVRSGNIRSSRVEHIFGSLLHPQRQDNAWGITDCSLFFSMDEWILAIIHLVLLRSKYHSMNELLNTGPLCGNLFVHKVYLFLCSSRSTRLAFLCYSSQYLSNPNLKNSSQICSRPSLWR